MSADATIVTLEEVRRDPEVQAFIAKADRNLDVLGYTEHAERHAGVVASTAKRVLLALERPARAAELAGIAGYLHDIGNAITRLDHGIGAALIARDVLRRMGMPIDEYTDIMAAIGNHEEEYGEPLNEIAAAVILGDKADVHKSRVRLPDPLTVDIHDRVNLASQRSAVVVDQAAHTIILELEIDTTISQVMDYFEIFLSRMIMCRRAAVVLGCQFGLVINGTRLL